MVHTQAGHAQVHGHVGVCEEVVVGGAAEGAKALRGGAAARDMWGACGKWRVREGAS